MEKINGQLTFLNRNGLEGATIKWHKNTFTIGSHDNCDISIVSEFIDSKHCILKLQKDEQAFLVHVGSNQFKTYLEDIEIKKPHVLNHNSIFTVGKSFIRFQYPQSSKWFRKENRHIEGQIGQQFPISIAMSTPKHPMYQIHCHRTNSPTVSPIMFTNTKISTILPIKRLNVRPFVTPIQNKSIDQLLQKSKLENKLLKTVSFGPNLSPETFDQEMPPAQPIKKGATPMTTADSDSIKVRKRKFSIVPRGSSVGVINKDNDNSYSSFTLSDIEPINDSFTDKAMAKARQSNVESPIHYMVPAKRRILQRNSTDPYEYSEEQEHSMSPVGIKRNQSIRINSSSEGLSKSVDESLNLDNIKAMENKQNQKILQIINRNEKENNVSLSNSLTKFRQLIRTSRNTNSTLDTDIDILQLNAESTTNYRFAHQNISRQSDARQSLNLQGVQELFDISEDICQEKRQFKHLHKPNHGKKSIVIQSDDKLYETNQKARQSCENQMKLSQKSNRGRKSRKSTVPVIIQSEEEQYEIDEEAGEYSQNQLEVSQKSNRGRKSRKSTVPVIIQSEEEHYEIDQVAGESSENQLEISQKSNRRRKSRKSTDPVIIQSDEEQYELDEEAGQLSENQLEISQKSNRGRKSRKSTVPVIIQSEEEQHEIDEEDVDFAEKQMDVSHKSNPGRKSRKSTGPIIVESEEEHYEIDQVAGESSENQLEISQKSNRGRKSRKSTVPVPLNLNKSGKLKRPYADKADTLQSKRLLISTLSKMNDAKYSEIKPIDHVDLNMAVINQENLEAQRELESLDVVKKTRGRPKKQVNESVNYIGSLRSENAIDLCSVSIANDQISNSVILQNVNKVENENSVVTIRKSRGRPKKQVTESVNVQSVFESETNDGNWDKSSIVEKENSVVITKKIRGRPKKQVNESVDAQSALESETNDGNGDKNSIVEKKNSVVFTKNTRGRQKKQINESVDAQSALESETNDGNGDKNSTVEKKNSVVITKNTRGRQKIQINESVNAQSALESETNDRNEDKNSLVEKENLVVITKKTRGRPKKQVNESVDAQSALESETFDGYGDKNSIMEKENSAVITKKTRGRPKKQVNESVDAQSVLESETNDGYGDKNSVLEKDNSAVIIKKTRGRQKKPIIENLTETLEPVSITVGDNQHTTKILGRKKEKVFGNMGQSSANTIENVNSLTLRSTRARTNTVKSDNSKLITDENKSENEIPKISTGQQKKLIENEISGDEVVGVLASEITENMILENNEVDEFKKPHATIKRNYKKKINQTNITSTESSSIAQSATFESTQEDTVDKNKNRKKNVEENVKNSNKENVFNTGTHKKTRSAAKLLENQPKLSDSETLVLRSKKRGHCKSSNNSDIQLNILTENKNTENSEFSGVKTRTRSKKMYI